MRKMGNDLTGDDLGEVDNEVEEQEKLEDFKNLWESELEEIQAIDDIEDAVSEFYSGEVLIRGVILQTM